MKRFLEFVAEIMEEDQVTMDTPVSYTHLCFRVYPVKCLKRIH